MKVAYDWLKEYVGNDMPTLEKVEKLLTFHAFEIDGVERVVEHDVLDVKILPDRSSDCLSHRGIAREIAALANTSCVNDPLAKEVSLLPQSSRVQTTIENPERCKRFGAAVLHNVQIGPSPEWLKSRLEAVGQRSINNVVDATNYVMLGLGQPLHAYDAAKLTEKDGMWRLGSRAAKEGESITSLSGDTYELNQSIELIVDAHTDTPLSLAGIKGGKHAEVTKETTTIILEAANFNPEITRKTSQALKLQTDASKRFENNLSSSLVPYALEACAKLIEEIAGATCEGYADNYPKVEQNPTVRVTLVQINALLGLTLTSDVVTDIFARLGFGVTQTGDVWDVVAPPERTDILIAEDLIAEVGRVYGYEHVASVVPATVPLTEYNTRHYYGEEIRRVLVEHGFSEVITSSFRKNDTITLQNALASDKGCMRSTLTKNIVEVLDRNIPYAPLLVVSDIRVFEIGTVFHKTEDGTDVSEHMSLAIGVRTKQQGYTPKDDVLLKEVVTALEATLGVSLLGNYTQGVCESNLSNLLAQLPPPTEYKQATSSERIFVPYSLYPFISRDVAVWVPEIIDAEAVAATIREKAGSLLVQLSLFDTFAKEGRISYAFRIIFQSFEKTLTDEEINPIMDSVYEALKAQGFEIR